MGKCQRARFSSGTLLRLLFQGQQIVSGHEVCLRTLIILNKCSSLILCHCSLAYAELYLTLAAIVPQFDMELFETTVEDVKPARDFFVPVPKLDSKGVRAKITGMNAS